MCRCWWLALLVACNAKHPPPPKQRQEPKPSAPAANDPWKPSAGPSVGRPTPTDPKATLDATLGFNGDLLVVKDEDFADYRSVLAVVEQTSDVVAAEPYQWAQLTIASSAWPKHIRVKGVDPKRIGAEKALASYLVSGTVAAFDHQTQPPAILLGDVLADKLGVAVGDTVRLNAPDDIGQPFRVTGTFHTKYDLYDEGAAIVAMPALQDVIGDGESIRAIGVWVTSSGKASTVADAIRKAVGGSPYVVVDNREINEDPFKAGLKASLAEP